MSTDPLHYPWWLASRSAGIVAFLLLSASVVLGLAMATRVAPVHMRRTLRVTHERVALLALAAILAHGLLLLGDPWLEPGLSLAVPFALGYRPVWTGLGVLAGYGAAALALSYYARRRLGGRRWRNAHRLIPVAWALAAVHALGAGTDGGSAWLRLPVFATVAAIGGLLAYRFMPNKRPPRAVVRSDRGDRGATMKLGEWSA